MQNTYIPVSLSLLSLWLSLTIVLPSGLPWSGKSQGKTNIFQGRGKSGKIFDIVKVSAVRELFCFPVYTRQQFITFLQEFEMHFLSEKMKSRLQSEQSDQFDSLRLKHVVVVVSGFCCECFLPNSFFLLLQKAERG